MRALFLLGRAVFGGFFIQNGINHFVNAEMLRQYAASKGVPSPDIAVAVSGALFLGGGLSVATGLKPSAGLLALVGSLVPVTLQMHRYWDADDPSERMSESVNFTKNLALVGASLMMLRIPEPWPASVDRLRDREDMYLHLKGSEGVRLLGRGAA